MVVDLSMVIVNLVALLLDELHLLHKPVDEVSFVALAKYRPSVGFLLSSRGSPFSQELLLRHDMT